MPRGYTIKGEDADTKLLPYQDSITLSNETGSIDLGWDEVHDLLDQLPKIIEDAEKTYW